MDNFKECLRMEELCKKLALAEPSNKERWQAEARRWRQRAGKIVPGKFGGVERPVANEGITLRLRSD